MHANWFIYTMYFLICCLAFIDPSQLSIYSLIHREVNVTILELILYSKADLEPILMDWGYRTKARHECLTVLNWE